MNLLTDRWVPSRTISGFEHISLNEAMSRPVREIQSGRPDFDFALLLFAIGIKQTGYKPEPVFGSGPRFLQSDVANGKGRLIPIGQLLIDEPGENAIKQNRDWLFRGNQRNAMCTSCAALTLYTHTIFAGPGGPGLYPSNLFHSALYLRKCNTLGETVEANVVNKNISHEAYFSAFNGYWLEEPHGNEHCKLCGNIGPVVTGFYRTKLGAQPTPAINPHMAKTRSGKRFSVKPTDGILKIVDGAALDSTISISPLAIAERAKVGDKIIGFGTCYDKATLTRSFELEFILRSAIDWRPLQNCVRSIMSLRIPRKLEISDYESTLAGEIRSNVEDMVFRGSEEVTAALAVFEMYCQNPGYRDQRRYPKWKYFRNQIEHEEELDV
jgi:hypothetical protein